MRDDLIGALAWIETFFPVDPIGYGRFLTPDEKLKSQDNIERFTIKERCEFTPGNDEKPYEFVRKLFETVKPNRRRSTTSSKWRLSYASIRLRQDGAIDRRYRYWAIGR